MASGLEEILYRPRPSPWQLFLSQPCIYLARLLFSWRRIMPAQAVTRPVSIVCISDTHNSQPPLPEGDVLIHAGDLTQSGTFDELQATLDWLRRQPHPVKIAVAGNHDTLLDKNRCPTDEHARQRQALDWGDVVYLENEERTVSCPNGRQLRVYGSPLSPRHGNWGFQYQRSQDVWAAHNISPDIDVLITHAPPHAHLDLQHGCQHLLRELWRVRPRLHVFGHVHEGAGTEWLQFDALQAAYEQTVLDKGGVINLVTVCVRWAQQHWRPAIEARCQLVNPAMVGGLRDDERRHPVTVVL